MDPGGFGTDADVKPVCFDKESTELEAEALNFLFNL